MNSILNFQISDWGNLPEKVLSVNPLFYIVDCLKKHNCDIKAIRLIPQGPDRFCYKIGFEIDEAKPEILQSIAIGACTTGVDFICNNGDITFAPHISDFEAK